MKTLSTFVAMLATVSLVFVIQPVSPAYAGGGQQIALLICNNIKGNDKYRLRKLLKENRLKVKKIYGAVQCDGLSMIRYSIKNNATAVGVFLVKRVPGSIIASHNDIAWATDNGFADNEITVAMKKRVGG